MTSSHQVEYHAEALVPATELGIVASDKRLQGTMPGGTNLHEQFEKADEGLKRLSVELLRFRKRPLGELVWEWGAKIFGKKAAAPNAGTVAPGEIGRSSAGSE